MLTTLSEFVLRVHALEDVSDAYYVFEMQCDESLRSLIYGLAGYNSNEPFRSAMHNMGFTSY